MTAEPSAPARPVQRDGYAAGYQDGYTAGYAAAEASMAALWTPVAERVRASAGRPAWAALLEYRGEEPDPAGGYRARPQRGGYPGGPVAWPESRTAPSTRRGS